MDESVRSRFLAYLEWLEPAGCEQVLSYLHMIEACSYAPDTLRYSAAALKLFVSELPGGGAP